MEGFRKSLEVGRKSFEKKLSYNPIEESHTKCAPSWSFFSLIIRSLGVIYGDIGTSPLYVMNNIFHEPPTKNNVIGGTSAVMWSFIIVVTLKYVVIK